MSPGYISFVQLFQKIIYIRTTFIALNFWRNIYRQKNRTFSPAIRHFLANEFMCLVSLIQLAGALRYQDTHTQLTIWLQKD